MVGDLPGHDDLAIALNGMRLLDRGLVQIRLIGLANLDLDALIAGEDDATFDGPGKMILAAGVLDRVVLVIAFWKRLHHDMAPLVDDQFVGALPCPVFAVVAEPAIQRTNGLAISKTLDESLVFSKTLNPERDFQDADQVPLIILHILDPASAIRMLGFRIVGNPKSSDLCVPRFPCHEGPRPSACDQGGGAAFASRTILESQCRRTIDVNGCHTGIAGAPPGPDVARPVGALFRFDRIRNPIQSTLQGGDIAGIEAELPLVGSKTRVPIGVIGGIWPPGPPQIHHDDVGTRLHDLFIPSGMSMFGECD